VKIFIIKFKIRKMERSCVMKKVYALYEERENSQLCGIRGIWTSRGNAIEQMKKLVGENTLYTNFSKIDEVEGNAESDPMYNEEMYSNYYVEELELI
jgi:hypothetical protein